MCLIAFQVDEVHNRLISDGAISILNQVLSFGTASKPLRLLKC